MKITVETTSKSIRDLIADADMTDINKNGLLPDGLYTIVLTNPGAETVYIETVKDASLTESLPIEEGGSLIFQTGNLSNEKMIAGAETDVIIKVN